jgi:hypothetical protein
MSGVPDFRRRVALATVAVVAALVSLAAGSPARACSSATGALYPTNYELVRGAEAIVLARSVRFAPSPKSPGFAMLTFEIEEVVAGDFHATSLTIDDVDLEPCAGRTPEDDFSVARPSAAACQAEDYRLGGRYLLFLRQWKRQWGISGPGFSRVNEEVDGPDSPWVQTVRRYLSVAALRNYDREKVALRQLRAKAAAGKEPKALAGALIGDIDRHFRTPSDAKSGPDLVALFQTAPSDRVRLDALWALAHTAPPEAKGFMQRTLLKETRTELKEARTDWLEPLGRYFAAVEDHSLFGPLAAFYARYPQNASERARVTEALAAAAGPGDSQRLVELLRGSSNSEATDLALGFARAGRDPRPAIVDLHRRLPESDYGRDSAMAMALAVMGDAQVVEWAERAVRPPRSSDADREYAVFVLAVSPLAAADAAVRELIAAGDPELLEQFVGAFNFPMARFNPRRWDQLDEILRVHAANPAVMSALELQAEYLVRDAVTPEERAMTAPLLARVQAAARDLAALK